MAKVKKAREVRGTRFLHLLSPCPTGWKMEEHLSPKAAVAAVETNIFPLYEIFGGLDYVINYRSKGLPVETYLSLRGRYRHLRPEDIQSIQEETDRNWEELQKKADSRMCE